MKEKMGEVFKEWIWPVIAGVIGVIVYFVSAWLTSELLLAAMNVPVVSGLLMIFTAGVGGLLLPPIAAGIITYKACKWMTGYDCYDVLHLRANRTVGVILLLLLALVVYSTFTKGIGGLSGLLMFLPMLIFALIMVFSR